MLLHQSCLTPNIWPWPLSACNILYRWKSRTRPWWWHYQESQVHCRNIIDGINSAGTNQLRHRTGHMFNIQKLNFQTDNPYPLIPLCQTVATVQILLNHSLTMQDLNIMTLKCKVWGNTHSPLINRKFPTEKCWCFNTDQLGGIELYRPMRS